MAPGATASILPEEAEHEFKQMYDAVIVGAGLAGLATAVGLFERGITNIVVLEKAQALQPVGASIAIFENGLRALDYLSPSVAKRARASCIPIEKMVVRDGMEGNILHEKIPHVHVNYMVWYLLQQFLGQRLPPGIVQLGKRVDSIEVANDDTAGGIAPIRIHTSDALHDISDEVDKPSDSTNTTTTSIRARVLIATDGINSTIRGHLFGKDIVRKVYHGKVSYRAVFPTSALLKNGDETICPAAGVNTTFQSDEKGKLFSYRETAPGILTVTSMAPVEDPTEDYHAATSGKSRERFRKVFRHFTAPEVQKILSVTPKSIRIDPIYDVDVLDCWWKGTAIVIGDAAHAMSPSMGQGANQSLEDASVLVHELTNIFTQTKAGISNDRSIALQQALKTVCRSRIDRVKRIHAASRARSFGNNETCKEKPLDLTSTELMELLIEIDSWRAPLDEKMSGNLAPYVTSIK
eukprot:CAMPEP_0194266184 /NCGR_PEP_ID=MMETSP0169-20130528/1174_1 /TAXON_ID=218684 /ORGANISM="Corethron pennatum, Strain L29A3" /LENGTH=464 /DNA_ID=CAMNT_0039006811 /DNA_START=14 /DNA_END=1408 /DNA_ORIENTATION=+